MYENFIFDGKSNELFGVICVLFGSQDGLETFNARGETDLQMEKSARGNEFYITSQKYTSTMTRSFQIMNIDASPITTDKQRALEKWLCKRNVFKPFQLDKEGYEFVRYNVNISEPKLINVCDTVGMEFTITTNAPYGFSPIIKKKFSITDTSKTIGINITNDEDEYVYPKMVITMQQAGNLIITNSTEVANRTFELDDLIVGEVITVDNALPELSSSTGHEPYTDFNKHWIRLVDGLNQLTFNLDCSVEIEYNEVRKVGLF